MTDEQRKQLQELDSLLLDRMQDIFIHGTDVHIVMCNADDDSECDHETHPHFEAFNWDWRGVPVRAGTLRDVIRLAIERQAEDPS